MSTVRTTLKNMAALATGQAAYRLGLVALEILLARSIAPAQFGEFAAALGFAGIFLVLMDMGIALGLVRAVSRRDEGAATYFGNSLALRAGIAAAMFPVMVGLSAWLHPATRVPLVALL
ncbi:MAG TPA: oligosaccharide flippase family protein, partial [Candidatus Polarisedimenticolaceae bacterium]|nr:oligosaccharide flippase family protein [Candidatus Polarisedimenticolaceae bacterium]